MTYVINTAHGKHITYRGNRFEQTTETGATETFTLERTGNDTYAIRTTDNKVLCFNNDHLELRDSIGDWEKFEVKPSPKGFTIRSPHFNKFLRAQPAGHFDGADQVGDWEQFTLQVAPGTYYFRTAHGQFVTATPDGKFSQCPRNQEWERFTIASVGNNLFSIRNAHNKFLCFNHDHLEARDSVGDWERFEIKPTQDLSRFSIFSHAHRKFLRPQPGGEGAHLDGAEQVGDWERFTLQPYIIIPAPGTYNLRTAHGQFVTATPDGKFSQCPRNQEWERFTIASVGNNLFSIRNAHNKFLCFNHDHLEARDSVGDWERFEIKPTQDHSRFTIYAPVHRKFLRAQPGGEGAHLDGADQAGDWERFTLQKV